MNWAFKRGGVGEGEGNSEILARELMAKKSKIKQFSFMINRINSKDMLI